MHNLIADESVYRISTQSGHALPSAWNRTLSIKLSPAGVYSVSAKVTVSLQSGCIWTPSLKLGPEVSSYYTRAHTFDDLFHFVSFCFVPFRSVPFRVLSLAAKSLHASHGSLESFCAKSALFGSKSEQGSQ